MTAIYTSQGFRKVRQGYEHIEHDRRGEPMQYRKINTARDAAWLFANRLAKREYGRKGYCHHARLDCASADGRYGHYECFIGVPAEGGGTTGKNIRLSVHIDPQAIPGVLRAWC